LAQAQALATCCNSLHPLTIHFIALLMGADPVINWLSGTVRVLLQRVACLEKGLESKNCISVDPNNSTPKTICISEGLGLHTTWNIHAAPFWPTSIAPNQSSQDSVDSAYDHTDFLRLPPFSPAVSPSDHDTYYNKVQSDHEFGSAACFNLKPSVGTWLQPLFTGTWEPVKDEECASAVSDTSDVSSLVSGVSDPGRLVEDLRPLEEVGELVDMLNNRVDMIDTWIERHRQRGMFEDARASAVERTAIQYRNNLESWIDEALAHDRLDRDYPWIKMRDHKNHWTESLTHRSDILTFYSDMSQHQACTMYWAKGICDILLEQCKAAVDKVDECDSFMTKVVQKLSEVVAG